jgi:hypothetical protein
MSGPRAQTRPVCVPTRHSAQTALDQTGSCPTRGAVGVGHVPALPEIALGVLWTQHQTHLYPTLPGYKHLESGQHKQMVGDGSEQCCRCGAARISLLTPVHREKVFISEVSPLRAPLALIAQHSPIEEPGPEWRPTIASGPVAPGRSRLPRFQFLRPCGRGHDMPTGRGSGYKSHEPGPRDRPVVTASRQLIQKTISLIVHGTQRSDSKRAVWSRGCSTR